MSPFEVEFRIWWFQDDSCPFGLFRSLHIVVIEVEALNASSLLTGKRTWRRERDSNPRYLLG